MQRLPHIPLHSAKVTKGNSVSDKYARPQLQALQESSVNVSKGQE